MNSEKNSFKGPHKLSCSHNASKNSSGDILPENNEKVRKEKPSTRFSKEHRKPKFLCQRKYYEPHIPPHKSAPVHVHISNPSAEVVLREKNVEIKDLESQVMFFKNKMKELQVENKTLQDIQSRQERELRKFKAGVADLPSVLKSHKHEMKAVESSAVSLRKELSHCQRDLRAKSDLILKKDQQIEKIQSVLRRNEKQIQESTLENKGSKLSNKKWEEECKRLSLGNEELKSKNDSLSKKIQQLNSSISNHEEKLREGEDLKNQLKESFSKLQTKYDELLQSEVALKKIVQVIKSDSSTQTASPETVSVSCMTIKPLLEKEIHSDHRGRSYKESKPLDDVDQESKIDFFWNARKQNTINDFPLRFSSSEVKNLKLDSRLNQKNYLEPLQMTLFDQKQDLRYEKSETEPETLISRENVTLHSNSPDHFLDYPFPCGNRVNQRDIESEDSETIYYGENEVSSSNSRTRLLKHLSNLTLK